MTAYGYIRVSTKEQNEARQIIAMAEAGITGKHLFVDKQSGKDFDRPAYKKMLKKLTKGDILYIKSIDRLGRDYDEIIDQWRIITKKKGCDIVVLDMPILDTRTKNDDDLTMRFLTELILQTMAFTAELERQNIKARQAEGIACAREAGVHLGRPRRELPDDWDDVISQIQTGELSKAAAARELGMPTTTLRNILARMSGSE